MSRPGTCCAMRLKARYLGGTPKTGAWCWAKSCAWSPLSGIFSAAHWLTCRSKRGASRSASRLAH